MARPVSIIFFVILTSCSSETPTSPGEPRGPAQTVVVFRYVSPVPPDMPPSDPLNLTGCLHHWAPVAGSGPAIKASWSSELFRPTRVTEEGVFTTVGNVPVGTEHVVQVWDLRLCYVNATEEPISFRTIFADGVELTRVVTHPSGLEGVAFQVTPNGRIVP